ncbi:hypothetical protein CHLNCDRAFT_134964 [Chlorella variabilis]|uniref:Uncharacterized protein n=1 Tax=Chlorella variabilis TaxID=554065 RepID=E1ZH83_CHLVA|nr:hypothetical protein CHLNCDRAFT_134964 [Chlorella variabilis]EFN54874.1 hypothetical protein CHLNCDRAFT_134964 [Chlorella variabilis]|eukprot:XP_005846976.1 hypothetical protein CHLNCDRAFT_134964 [Chlorella variabilis]
MGASLSSEGEPGGVITVQQTGAIGPQQDDEAYLRQLAELQHSLPILPDSVAEPSSIWAKTLGGSSAAGASTKPLQQLVADYQRFTRWHCRRIVEQQEKLNAGIPKLEQQAEWVQQRAAESCRKMLAAQANLAGVADVQRELEELTSRLQRVQQSMAEVERLVAAQKQQKQRQWGEQRHEQQEQQQAKQQQQVVDQQPTTQHISAC